MTLFFMRQFTHRNISIHILHAEDDDDAGAGGTMFEISIHILHAEDDKIF